MRNKIHTYICKECNKEFKTSYIKQKFCCKECANINSSKIRRQINEYIFKKDYIIIILNSKKYGQYFAMVDKEDLDKIKNFCWTVIYDKNYKGFYVVARENRTGKLIRLHRLITDCPLGMVVDHINHNTLDNRKQNLKICTNIENMQNIKSNKTGVVGVCYHKIQRKYQSYISINNKKKYLGSFDTLEEAKNIRKIAELKYFGNKINNII